MVGGLILENVVVGAIAAVIGWLLAGFLAPSLQLGIGRTIGPQDPSWSWLGLVVCVAAGFVPALQASRTDPMIVLRAE